MLRLEIGSWREEQPKNCRKTQVGAILETALAKGNLLAL
jgi:hypothetical protein